MAWTLSETSPQRNTHGSACARADGICGTRSLLCLAPQVPGAEGLLGVSQLVVVVAGRQPAARIRGRALEQVAEVLVDLLEVLHEQGRQRPFDISAPPSDALDRVVRREGPEGV